MDLGLEIGRDATEDTVLSRAMISKGTLHIPSLSVSQVLLGDNQSFSQRADSRLSTLILI